MRLCYPLPGRSQNRSLAPMTRRTRNYESIGLSHVGTLLAEALGDSGRVRQALGVWPAWEQAVGPQVATRARPVALRDGILYVNVAHPVWLQELTPMRETLLRQLQKQAGKAVVRDLRFRVGMLPLQDKVKPMLVAPPEAARGPIPYEMARTIRSVPSSGLRSVMVRVASRWAALPNR